MPPGFDTASDALDWVTRERPGLVATVNAATGSHPTDAVRLALDLAHLFLRVRAFEDWVSTATAAVEAAAHSAEPTLTGPAWNNLGNALQAVRRFDEAITAHQQARDIYQELGDRHGEGSAWGNLGLALQAVQGLERAKVA